MLWFSGLVTSLEAKVWLIELLYVGICWCSRRERSV